MIGKSDLASSSRRCYTWICRATYDETLDRINQVTLDSDGEDHASRAGGVTAVSRAFEILNAISESTHDMTLLEISERTGLPRSTVHRILQTLLEHRVVASKGRAGGIRLGPELVRLASISRTKLIQTTRPFIEQLSQRVGEGVSVAVLDGSDVRFLDQAVGGQGLRAVSLVGSSFPAHCTANGKALLAQLPASVRESTLPVRLARLTPQTITQRSELFEELARVRETGVAFDREEHHVGVCAVGATVHDGVGNLAAITIAAPASRFYANEDTLVKELRSTVAHVTDALCYVEE